MKSVASQSPPARPPGMTAEEDMASILQAVVAQIECDLDRRLQDASLPENLREAVRYAALSGGKRLRPALSLLCCEATGGARTDALAAAGAIELVHTFSLVHDDLPAMDDDDLRRGQPALHVHAGEAMAILGGDVMVALAFEWIARAALDPGRRIQLVQELAAATTAMIAGQVYDTLGGFGPGLSDQQRLHLIHHNKTGALMRAACRMGAICGKADNERLNALTRYGEALGPMFQIVDDLIDVTQSAEHTGKATGKDASAGKLTFPGLLGVTGSRAEIARLGQLALDSLAPFGPAAGPLRHLCQYMAVRTK